MPRKKPKIASIPLTLPHIGGALQLPEAGRYLGGLSVATMRRFIDRGLLRPCRASRRLLIPIVELERFLSSDTRSEQFGIADPVFRKKLAEQKAKEAAASGATRGGQ
jgi:hypothetical protein